MRGVGVGGRCLFSRLVGIRIQSGHLVTENGQMLIIKTEELRSAKVMFQVMN